MRLAPGACGYGELDSKLWPFYLVTGISPRNALVQNRPQASCGTCLEVRCVSADPKACVSNESITVVIVDECVQCEANELNLHAFAFQQIADTQAGSAAIQYRQVECAPMDQVIVRVDGFRVVQGGWLRLTLKSVASDAGIVRVELARSTDGGAVGSNSTDATSLMSQGLLDDGLADSDPTNTTGTAANSTGPNWKSMDNTYGAQWEMSALPAPPYDLRLTDSFGRKVVLPRAIVKAGAVGEFPGHAQFPALDNAAVAARAPSRTPAEVRPTNATSSAMSTPASAAVPASAAAPAASPPITPATSPKLLAAATPTPKPAAAGTQSAAAKPTTHTTVFRSQNRRLLAQ